MKIWFRVSMKPIIKTLHFTIYEKTKARIKCASAQSLHVLFDVEIIQYAPFKILVSPCT